MSVKPVIQSVEPNNNSNKFKKEANMRSLSYTEASNMPHVKQVESKDSVTFTGANPVVGLMDFIEKGGYVQSLGYIILSVLICLLSTGIGAYLAKNIWVW